MFRKMAFTDVYREPVIQMESSHIKLPDKTLHSLSKQGLANLLQNNNGL